MKCFDCERDDWMNRFHHTENRSFCNECHLKRSQPERSKREDCFSDFKELGHEMVTIPLSDECWCVKCQQPNFVIRENQMRCSEQ